VETGVEEFTVVVEISGSTPLSSKESSIAVELASALGRSPWSPLVVEKEDDRPLLEEEEEEKEEEEEEKAEEEEEEAEEEEDVEGGVVEAVCVLLLLNASEAEEKEEEEDEQAEEKEEGDPVVSETLLLPVGVLGASRVGISMPCGPADRLSLGDSSAGGGFSMAAIIASAAGPANSRSSDFTTSISRVTSSPGIWLISIAITVSLLY